MTGACYALMRSRMGLSFHDPSRCLRQTWMNFPASIESGSLGRANEYEYVP